MRTFQFLIITSLLIRIDSVLGAEVDPIVKASAYGDKTTWSYSSDEPVPWSLFKPNDFSTVPIDFSAEGVRPLGQVPPAGVHPRLFFSAEDLPAIRKRLKETNAGQAAWKNVLAYSNALRLTYDDKADYAKPDVLNGGWGGLHARVPIMLAGGYKHEDWLSELADGKKPTDGYSGHFVNMAAVDAFRCLIEDDAVEGKRLASAVTTWVKLEQEHRAQSDKPVKPGEPPNPSTNKYTTVCLALIYDFIFNWMADDQKKIVHDELVTQSAWHDNYGTFNNAETARSNWATFSYWTYDLLAIEGEPGFNDLKFRGLYRGWRNFYTTSYFKSGAVFEGEGKSLLGIDSVVMFDRLANKYGLSPLSEHPTIRNHYGNFTIKSLQPTEDKFVFFDMLGGLDQPGVSTPIDLIIAHYLYPQDKRIDFLYRCAVGDDYMKLPNRCDWVWNMVVLSAIFATNYDSTVTPQSLALSNTFFCGQRAVMMTRSSWDKDATFLTMHVRGASGGHPYRDRNGIMLTGQGRSWVTIPWDGGQDLGWKCDTVLIDGREQSNSTPGRVVDYVDNPLATFMVGDAKYCWDWVWGGTGATKNHKSATKEDVLTGNLDLGVGWKLVDQTFNDFAYTKIRSPAFDMPLKFSPDWRAVDGAVSARTKEVNLPVIKSFRTAGLVRGTHPYALIVDDIQRDCMPAQYDWNLTLMNDLQEISKQVDGAQSTDMIMTPKPTGASAQTGSPALLVRLLDAGGPVEGSVQQMNDAHKPAGPKDKKTNLLTISCVSIAPRFKVLLYPFKLGEALPITAWNTAHDQLLIQFPGQSDQVDFSPGECGKTDVRILRSRQEIVALNHPIPKLIDPDTDALDQQIAQLPKQIESAKGFDPEGVPGLVASWSMDTILNGSLPPNQPTIPGIPATGVTLEPGIIGNAARFPNAGVTVPIDLRKSIQKAFTMSFWLKADSHDDATFIDINGPEFFSMDIGQDKIRFNAQGQWFYGGTISASNIDKWTHFAVTSDGSTIVVYRNGQPLMTLPGTRELKPPGSFRLGKGYNGLFDDFRIYNEALDPSVIQKIYLKGYFGRKLD